MRFWLNLPSCSASSFIRAVSGPRKYVCSTSSPRTSPLSPAWCTRLTVCMWAWSAALWRSTPDHKVCVFKRRDRPDSLHHLIISSLLSGFGFPDCLFAPLKLPEFELVWCEIAAVRDGAWLGRYGVKLVQASTAACTWMAALLVLQSLSCGIRQMWPHSCRYGSRLQWRKKSGYSGSDVLCPSILSRWTSSFFIFSVWIYGSDRDVNFMISWCTIGCVQPSVCLQGSRALHVLNSSSPETQRYIITSGPSASAAL